MADPAVTAAFYLRVFGIPVLPESDRLVGLDVTGKIVLLLFRTEAAGRPFDAGGG